MEITDVPRITHIAYDENRTQVQGFCLLAKWSFHDTIKKRELALKIRECEREHDGGWRGGEQL